MARHESEREDLLAEATALVERVELELPGGEVVVAGFRRDGSLSLFFGEDPVYQFNAHNELRRAYAGGLLYKAVRGKLVELRRERTAAETQLISRPLHEAESQALLADVTNRLAQLQTAVQSSRVQVLRQVPAGTDILGRLVNWLQAAPSIPIAARPNAG